MADVGDKRRLRMPDDALPVVEWAPAATEMATFEKMELGRVRLLPGTVYGEAVSSAGADAEALRDARALLSCAKWEREQRIAVPVEMTWHLFGPGIIRGTIYVHPTPECFELWAERYYERWTIEARQRRDAQD